MQIDSSRTTRHNLIWLGLAAALVGCASDLECRQLTVSFQRDVPVERVEELVSGADAEIIQYPVLSTAYNLALPCGADVEASLSYFRSLPEVTSAFESFDLGDR